MPNLKVKATRFVSILEKVDDAMNSIEKVNIERCQEKLKEGKALILKR